MLTSIVAVLGILAAVVSSIGAIWVKGVKPSVRFIKSAHDVFDKVMEYDDRLSRIETNSKQLTNNGGTHLKDAVDRIERGLNEHLTYSAKFDAETKNEFLNIYKAIAGIAPAGREVR